MPGDEVLFAVVAGARVLLTGPIENAEIMITTKAWITVQCPKRGDTMAAQMGVSAVTSVWVEGAVERVWENK